MKILVTGATGFIGSHVAAALAREGHAVRVSTRRTSDRRWIDGLDAEEIVADVGDADDVARLVAGQDAIVHGAGVTRAIDRETYIRINADATRRLASAAAAAGVGSFVLLSSLAARGPDQAQAPGDAPVSWYGLSKLLGERALEGIGAQHAMSGVALRLGGVYGPRDADLLPLFQSATRGLLPLPPAGLQAQPVHVDDVVEAVLAALSGDPGFGPWPIAEAKSYGWKQLGAELQAAFDRRVLVFHLPHGVFLSTARVSERWAAWRNEAPRLDLRRAEDLSVFSYTTDIAPSVNALGWSPAVPMREGIARTAAWYRAAGWLE